MIEKCSVKVYTLEGCPKCEILKKKMREKRIEFIECTDKKEMMMMGIDTCPVLEINDLMLQYKEAVEFINKMEVF